MRLVKTFSIIAIIFITMNIQAQTQKGNKQHLRRVSEVDYLSWVPANYHKDKSAKFPVLIFLHGSGERGHDLAKVKAWGPPSFIEQHPEFPFILLSPQCPEGRWWDIFELNSWLNKMMKKYRIDPSRVYLTGLSMGGFATWQWASAYPERFAAIAPVCGGGDIQFASKLNNLPIWAFHGEADPVVPVHRTLEMVDAVNSNKGNARKTIYPGVGHDSWKKAYADQELYKWLLDKKK